MTTVTLNVGGTLFTTQRDTLLKEPSSRLALLARGLVPSVRDASGAIFLDRDPTHFQLLLNWLRDGWMALPPSPEARAALLVEARHYALLSCEAWLRAQVGAIGGGVGSPRSPSPTASPYAPRSPLFTGMAGLRVRSPGSPPPPPHARPPGGISGSPVPPPRVITTPVADIGHTSTTWAAAHGSPSMAAAASDVEALRDAFRKATAPYPVPSPAPGLSLPEAADVEGKWTSKYLRTNEGVRQAVNTLLELAYLAPHPSLTAGRVAINITPAMCDHERASSLVGGVAANHRRSIQNVSVTGLGTGWKCEFPIRPDSEQSLYDKYDVCQMVRDNWFVMTAIFKDMHGILLEEQGAGGRAVHGAAPASLPPGAAAPSPGSPNKWPACSMCKRHTLAVILHKIL